MTVPAGQTNATVGNLKEGEEYEFRVRAKNKAGRGAPSDPSDTVMCKPRNGRTWSDFKTFLVAPKIDRNSLQEIKVRAGQPFHLDIPVTGEPPPEISWDFEGTPVKNNDRMKVDNTQDYKTKFTCKRSVREDSGMYTITAKNANGTDTAQVKVSWLLLWLDKLHFR